MTELEKTWWAIFNAADLEARRRLIGTIVGMMKQPDRNMVTGLAVTHPEYVLMEQKWKSAQAKAAQLHERLGQAMGRAEHNAVKARILNQKLERMKREGIRA